MERDMTDLNPHEGEQVMSNLLAKASDMSAYKRPSEPLEVLAFLLEAVETYGPDYMHGLPKNEYVEAARAVLRGTKP